MSYPLRAEQEIIKRAQQGDDDAFEQLVIRYTPSLFRVVNRMTGDSSESEAIVQESFLRVWRALPRYKINKPLFPFLVTIATNLYRDQWRKNRHIDFGGFEPLEESVANNELYPEEMIEQAEILQTLAHAVEELPPQYRTVIALRYDAGLKYQEIAEALGIPVNTVRTHLRRAKIILRNVLENEFGNSDDNPSMEIKDHG